MNKKLLYILFFSFLKINSSDLGLSSSQVNLLDDQNYFFSESVNDLSKNEKSSTESQTSPILKNISIEEQIKKLLNEEDYIINIYNLINELYLKIDAILIFYYRKNNINTFEDYKKAVNEFKQKKDDLSGNFKKLKELIKNELQENIKDFNNLPSNEQTTKSFTETINSNTTINKIEKLIKTLSEFVVKLDTDKQNIETFKSLYKEITNIDYFLKLDDKLLKEAQLLITNQDFIKDTDLFNLINSVKKNSSEEIYIKLAIFLYANIEKIRQESNNLLTRKFKDNNNKDYEILSWNLFHVFLGTIEKNKSFSGVHSKTIIPGIIVNKEIYTSLPCSDTTDVFFIFYQISNNKYYFKTSTMFPDNMNLKDCLESVSRALENILITDKKSIPKKDEIQKDEIQKDEILFTGIDINTNLIIRIHYNPEKKTIKTFYPLGVWDKKILNNDTKEFEQFCLEKSKKSASGYINKDNYEKIKKEIISGSSFDDIKKALDENLEPFKDESRVNTPVLEQDANKTQGQPIGRKKSLKTSSAAVSENEQNVSSSDFLSIRSESNPTPTNTSTKPASTSESNSSPTNKKTPSQTPSQTPFSFTEKAENNINSLKNLYREFKEHFELTFSHLLNQSDNNQEQLAQSSSTAKRSPENDDDDQQTTTPSKKLFDQDDDDDQQDAMNAQAKMGEKATTQPPSTSVYRTL